MGETMMNDLICNGIAEKAKEENKPCKYFNKLIYLENSIKAYYVT